ncbi:hypothetical protein UFOVP26_1, partial [uncultured Caudovirales phage]
KFDKQSGNRFSTYYVVAMQNECRKVIHANANSVKTTSVEEIACYQDDGLSIFDITPSEDATPSEVFEMKEHALKLVQSLSVRTRMVIKSLVSPGVALVQAFKDREDYAERCHAQGIRTSYPKEIDVNFIAQFYGFSRRETEIIKEELRRAVGDNSLWRYKK